MRQILDRRVTGVDPRNQTACQTHWQSGRNVAIDVDIRIALFHGGNFGTVASKQAAEEPTLNPPRPILILGVQVDFSQTLPHSPR